MNEHNFQVNVVRTLRSQGIRCFAVPNGGHRSKSTGKKLKAEGVLAGVSDLIILHKGKVLFVELKNPYKKSYQRDTQKEFQKEVEAEGHKYYLIKTWQEFEDFLKELKK